MRIKDFLVETTAGNMLVKNGITYLPLNTWLKQELGTSAVEPDADIDEDTFGDFKAPGKYVADEKINAYLKTLRDDKLLSLVKTKINPNTLKYKGKPEKYENALKLQQAAKDELGRRETQPTARTPAQRAYDFKHRPHVHASPIHFIDNGHEVNVDEIRNIIKTRPKEILGSNAKMDHSGGVDQVYFKIGLPALQGMAIDEATDRFIFVNTCPGAGDCRIDCFAKKGNYIVFANVWQHSSRVLNMLINDPHGFVQQLENEIQQKVAEYEPKGIKVGIRWHDSGDFFSPEYAHAAFELAGRLPNVDFFAYTKFSDAMTATKPDNFITNWSEGATKAQDKKVAAYAADQGDNFKRAIKIPREAFKDLVHKIKSPEKSKDNEVLQSEWNSPEAERQFKQWMAKEYNLPLKSIISYDELVKIPKGNQPKWNVIVKTGDGDISANRRDVIGTYLFAH